jgi:mono/diheme cytochrome c family protein
MMFRVVALALFVAACAAEGKQIPRTQIGDPGEVLFNGYTKPNVTCYKCHNGDGTGTKRGPALASRVPKLTDDEIRNVILNGKGKMPAWRGKLTDEEVAQLTKFLRERFGQSAR